MALMYYCMVACIHTHFCMYLIPSPAHSAARSCPDVWKWLGRPKGLPVSGIWAPPYYFNHFRSSRLVTRIVIHRGSYMSALTYFLFIQASSTCEAPTFLKEVAGDLSLRYMSS